MLSEEKMLFEISDILGDVPERMISIYIDDPFKAVWSSTLKAFRVLPAKHNKIMGKEEGLTLAETDVCVLMSFVTWNKALT